MLNLTMMREEEIQKKKRKLDGEEKDEKMRKNRKCASISYSIEFENERKEKFDSSLARMCVCAYFIA